MSDDLSHELRARKVDNIIRKLRNVDPDSKRITKQPKFHELVKELCDHANEHGLTAQQIEELIDVAASSTYSDTTSGKLIRCMLPSQHIPEIVAVKTISWMTCSFKPSLAIQTLLVRWLVLVYDYITPKIRFHALYGVIYHFIQSDALRPHVCHLLFQMTRREDITAFRVRQLLTIHHSVGQQPPVLGLLSLYKLYHPNLVSYAAPRRRMVFFRQTDKAWSVKIRDVRAGHEVDDAPNVSMSRLTLSDKLITSPVSKKARVAAIPSDRGHDGVPPRRGRHQRHQRTVVELGQIDSFDDLLDNIDTVEFPPQAAAALKNEYLRHVINCNPDEIVSSRLSYWLGHVLFDDIMGSPPEPRGEVLLNAIVDFVEFLDEGIPAVDQFLIHYLIQWNGQDYRSQILSLLTRLRLYNHADLKLNLLDPLSRLMARSSVLFKCQVILCLTKLLDHYIQVELSRYRNAQQLADTSAINIEAKNVYSVFRDDIDDADPDETLRLMIDHVYVMCERALMQEHGNIVLLHCTLSLAHMVLSWQSVGRLPYISLPPAHITHTALYSRDAYSLNCLGDVVCLCKKTFRHLKSSGTSMIVLDPVIDRLNTHVQTIMDALWLKRPFSNRETALYKPGEDMAKRFDIPLPNLSLSVYHHQAFLPYALSFMEELGLPLLFPAELREYEQDYLDYLHASKLTGVHQFLHTSSKRLMSRTLEATASLATGHSANLDT